MNIKSDNFYSNINKKYKKFKINKDKRTLKDICYPRNFKLQKPQKFVPEYINPKNNNKGILVYHRIGSGKTCTAIRVAEEWKKKRKIMVKIYVINNKKYYLYKDVKKYFKHKNDFETL